MFEAATLVGGACGVAAKVYMNAIRKMPLTRAPWEHVVFGVVGGYMGYGTASYEAAATVRIAEHEAKLAEHNAVYRERLAARQH